jgi:hypothetical protein
MEIRKEPRTYRSDVCSAGLLLRLLAAAHTTSAPSALHAALLRAANATAAAPAATHGSSVGYGGNGGNGGYGAIGASGTEAEAEAVSGRQPHGALRWLALCMRLLQWTGRATP